MTSKGALHSRKNFILALRGGGGLCSSEMEFKAGAHTTHFYVVVDAAKQQQHPARELEHVCFYF
jgi:hypothetical protein